MIEWRQKSKPKEFPGPKVNPPKNPMSNFRALKVSRKQNKFGCTLFAEVRGRETRTLPRIVRLFWIPKKSLLKSSHPPKNTCKIFLAKKIPESKISSPFDHPRHLSRLVLKWMILLEYEWMKQWAEDGRSIFRLRSQLSWHPDCSSFYRDFLKLTKEESYQNGSRYRAIMSLFLVAFLTKLEPVYYVTHTAF